MAIERALISVYDKTGVVEFARELASLGIEIVSTGGTAKLLRDAGIPVRDVSDLTGWPEMLGGRVKTLHPKVHGGILFQRGKPEDRKQAAEHSIVPIDLVVVNLYPFSATAAKPGVTAGELIENIDIGGPAMVRSAAKNFQSVGVVTDPDDYAAIAAELREKTRTQPRNAPFARAQSLRAHRALRRRNRHGARTPRGRQRRRHHRPARKIARANPYRARTPPVDALWRKSASGRRALRSRRAPGRGSCRREAAPGQGAFLQQSRRSRRGLGAGPGIQAPAVAIIKHNNPCGAAEQDSLRDAYLKALACDPVSAYGSVLAFNRALDAATADEVAKLFVECIVAPGYQPAALAAFASKKNLRLLELETSASSAPAALDDLMLKPISGGMLVQEADRHELTQAELKVVTGRAPTEAELRGLLFGWKVAKHVKSNAIVFARERQTVGIGAGQMSRVDSVKIAVMKAATASLSLAGSVVASDAFFPFADGVEEAGKAGATAVIQPGGSVHDADVIAAANKLGMAMVFTGVRHFRH